MCGVTMIHSFFRSSSTIAVIFGMMTMVSCLADPLRVVILGDSISSGYRLKKEQAYPALIEKLAHADGYQVVVVNAGLSGDTTSGAMSISLTALGFIEPGKQLTRVGAKPGDLVVVSGTIGGAACALQKVLAGKPVDERHLLDRPKPRVSLGQVLKGYASACIDISDGLLADLGHVLMASGCGARLDIESLPSTHELAGLEDELRWHYQLSGGDDYELLFTLPAEYRSRLETWSQQLSIKLSVIGEIEEDEGIRCLTNDGTEFLPQRTGFEHFRQKP